MQHPMHRVTSFAIVGPLKDLGVFNAVSLSDDAYTLVWPNGADFDPATLHDWPEVEAEFIAMAQSWASRRALTCR